MRLRSKGSSQSTSTFYNTSTSTPNPTSDSTKTPNDSDCEGEYDKVIPVLANCSLPSWKRYFANYDGKLKKGIKIDSEYLTHLRFGDDIIIFANSMEELQEMPLELNQASLEVGLSMNLKKTKVMYKEFAEDVEEPTIIHSYEIEVDHYITSINASPWILPRRNKRSKDQTSYHPRSHGKRLVERVQSSKTDILIFPKRQVYDKCILPTVTYGFETWNLMKQQTLKLRTRQRSHERIRLNNT